MNDVLASFAIALGFEVNQGSLNAAKKSLADYEKVVKESDARIEKAKAEGAKASVRYALEVEAAQAREALEAARTAKKVEQAETQKVKAHTEGSRRQADAIGFSVVKYQLLVRAAEEAARAIVSAVSRMSSSYDNLYFQSQRAGASVQSLKSIGYAFSQVGGSTQQAVGAVESFAKAMRENDGVKSFVKGLGVDLTKDTADQLLDTVEKLNKHEYQVGFREAGLAGISEEDYNLITRQLGALRQYREEYNATTKMVGLNSEQAAAASVGFQRVVTRLQATAAALSEKLLVSLVPALTSVVQSFQNWIRSNPKAVERILQSITDFVTFLTTKLDKLIKSWGEDGGAAFIKQWDQFAARTEQIALSLERMVIAAGKLAGYISTINEYEVTPGAGTVSTWLLNKLGLGAGGGGALGVGAVGGFNPLQPGAASATPPDDRTTWQKYAPKILGGKDAPAAGDGSRSFRNNNPGNIKMGPFAKRMGATGKDDKGFARFPSYEAGRKAQESLLFESEGYKGLTIRQAIAKWAPGSDGNDPEGYAAQMAQAAGVGADTKLADLTPDQRGKFLDAQQAKEGWVPGAAPAKQVAGGVAPVNGVGGVVQAQGGAERRRQPITDRLMSQLATAATAAGANVEVYSGGQDDHGTMRKGSHRHDHGNAADVRLYVTNPDGSKRYLSMNNEADRKQMETFLREGVKAGATGIGAGPGYMGEHGIHIGGGPVAAWGAGGASANAPDWVRRALAQGLEDRAKPTPQPVTAQRPTAPAPNMTPGGFDVNKIDPRDLMKAPPLGSNSVNNSTANDNRAVHQTFNTNTTIHEARNTKEAARVMAGAFEQMHGLAQRNAQTAVG